MAFSKEVLNFFAACSAGTGHLAKRAASSPTHDKKGSPDVGLPLRELRSVLLRGLSEDATVFPGLKHPLGLALELADPLPGDPELVGELGEGRRILRVEAVAPDEHVTLALGEALYGLAQALGLHLAHDLVRRVGGALVLHEVAELGGVGVLRHGLV